MNRTQSCNKINSHACNEFDWSIKNYYRQLFFSYINGYIDLFIALEAFKAIEAFTEFDRMALTS